MTETTRDTMSEEETQRFYERVQDVLSMMCGDVPTIQSIEKLDNFVDGELVDFVANNLKLVWARSIETIDAAFMIAGAPRDCHKQERKMPFKTPYFTPKPGAYCSGYVFTTDYESDERISGEVVDVNGQSRYSAGFDQSDVIPIKHPNDYLFEYDTGPVYKPKNG